MKPRSITRRVINIILIAELSAALALSVLVFFHEERTRLRALDVGIRGRADSLLGAIQDAEDTADNVLVDPTELRLPQGDYRNLHKLRHEQGWTRRWDDETKTPWLLAPDRSAVIGYDDAESVALKTEWAMKQGFRGVFFWQVAGDRLPNGTNPLQEASRKAWDKAATGSR